MDRRNLMLELKKLTGVYCDVVSRDPYWVITIGEGYTRVIPSFSLSDAEPSDLAYQLYENWKEKLQIGIDYNEWLEDMEWPQTT